MDSQGASVVITHHILEERQNEYEIWLNEIGPVCRSFAGNIDWQIIRPIPNLTFTYTVVIRFHTIENLKRWMESDERKNLIRKANPLLAKEDSYYIKTGLDFLFHAEIDQSKVPVRWKQYLVTWSAIYPLSLLIPFLILPLMRYFGIGQNRFADAFVISGCIVFIMVYWLMPNYTKLIRKWLFK